MLQNIESTFLSDQVVTIKDKTSAHKIATLDRLQSLTIKDRITAMLGLIVVDLLTHLSQGQVY